MAQSNTSSEEDDAMPPTLVLPPAILEHFQELQDAIAGEQRAHTQTPSTQTQPSRETGQKSHLYAIHAIELLPDSGRGHLLQALAHNAMATRRSRSSRNRSRSRRERARSPSRAALGADGEALRLVSLLSIPTGAWRRRHPASGTQGANQALVVHAERPGKFWACHKRERIAFLEQWT